jgi:predicted ester cyclase
MNTISENKSVIEDFHRRVNAGDIQGAAALAAEDLVNHAAIPEAQGRAGLISIFGKLRAGFPDMQGKVEDVIAEGDRVVARIRMTGTHTGPLAMSRWPLPPTGKSVDVEQVHVYRLAAGVIVEHWGGRDDFGMIRQLGLTLAPAAK